MIPLRKLIKIQGVLLNNLFFINEYYIPYI